MGLLLPHNCTLFLYPDAIRIQSLEKREGTEGGKRGRVTGFSKESRLRLFRLLHTLEYEKVTFVTLTYPAKFPADGRVVKNHLRAFREALERKYGEFRVIWRLEFQKRGAPHFHLLLLDAPYICKNWLSLCWFRVVGSWDYKHLLAGTNIQLVARRADKRLIMSYVGKYVGKVDQANESEVIENVGRYWGKWNLKEGQGIEVVVSQAEATFLVARICRNVLDGSRYEPADPNNCTLFGDSPGSSDFARRVILELEAIRRAKQRRYARIELPNRLGR